MQSGSIPAYAKLARKDPEFPGKRSVQHLAAKHLAPINEKTFTPEASMFVSNFLEHVYLPAATNRLRPSTYQGYLGIVNRILLSRVILRHSDIGTTLQFYVQTSPQESREALSKIEENFLFGL